MVINKCVSLTRVQLWHISFLGTVLASPAHLADMESWMVSCLSMVTA